MEIKAHAIRNAYGYGYEVWSEVDGHKACIACKLSESDAESLARGLTTLSSTEGEQE